MQILLLLAVLFLAAANGANDNFKGVATLYGSRRAGYRTSLAWASVTTLAGSLCSAFIAHALLEAFTGSGLVPANVAGEVRFAFAVAGGGALTVALAGWLGMPISTTNALVGAMIGAGLVAIGTAVQFSALGSTFMLPLVASPLLALVPAWLLAPSLRRWLGRGAARLERCLCIAETADAASDMLALREMSARPVMGSVGACRDAGAQPVARWNGARIADAALFLLGGAVSFARGLNDTPKMAALLLPVAVVSGDSTLAVGAVGFAILLGGLLGARRVARTLSDKITALDVGGALAAGVTTSLLVCTASFNGLPVSTTQVSVGALAGTGLTGSGDKIDRKVMTNIILSWVVTLPVGAACGALLYWVAR